MVKAQTSELPDAGTLQTLLALAADEYLTPEQAREEARVSRQTIYNWIHDTENPLPATKAGGWKIRRGDLARYMQEKHSKGGGAAAEGGESNQTLRAHLLKLIEIGRAALEFKHACQVLVAASGSCDFSFIEKCSNECIARRDELLAVISGIDDETLSRLRFMLPSITSSLTLRSEEATAGGQAH